MQILNSLSTLLTILFWYLHGEEIPPTFIQQQPLQYPQRVHEVSILQHSLIIVAQFSHAAATGGSGGGSHRDPMLLLLVVRVPESCAMLNNFIGVLSSVGIKP